MVKESKFDEKIQRAENIIAQLERTEAITMDEYRGLAAEVTGLLQQCKDELKGVIPPEE